MGYGGALIWTGLAQNLKREFPDKKIIFIYKTTLRSFLFFNKNSDFIIYKNNKDISLVTNKFWWFFVRFFLNPIKIILIDMQNKKYHYWIKDDEEKIVYRTDGHAIEIACKPFNLKSVVLRTKINLTNKEIKKGQKIIEDLGIYQQNYICVEPNTKKTFTENKQWPLISWQKLVDLLNNWLKTNNLNYKILQIGAPSSHILSGVISAVGKTDFRDIKYLTDNSKIVIANEGGVAHLSSSGKTKAFIISNPSLPEKLMTYPQNINILPEGGHHNCGLKKKCLVCQNLMNSIKPEDVFNIITENLTP